MPAKVSVLGSGLMGSEIALDLLSNQEISVTLLDSDLERLKALCNKATRRYGDKVASRLETYRLDIVKETDRLASLLKNADVAIGALPPSVAETAVRAGLRAGVNYVDLIFSWRYDESSRELDVEAKKKGMTLIPACGLAPGLTNMIARDGVENISEAIDVGIYVGGIPQLPEGPLEYKIVFSATSVLEEYTREAIVVRKGKVLTLPALSEVEEVNFSSLPGVKFEAFITDGLSTLTRTLKVENMYEKTVRWPGHAKKVSTLIELGLLSQEKINLSGKEVSPRELLSYLLEKKLKMREGDKDMTLLKVVIKGKERRRIYEMVDYYDERNAVTSMARTTGYTCSSVAQMLLEGEIDEKGFIPPELAIYGERYRSLVERLATKGILMNVKEEFIG